MAEEIEQDITVPSDPPQSTDRPNFRARADGFVVWMKVFATQIASLIPQLNVALAYINTMSQNAFIYSQAATSAQVVATQKATIATDQATIAINSASQANASAQVCAAYANMQWTGFGVTDGELIVSIADASVSTPSIVDGEFIITLGA